MIKSLERFHNPRLPDIGSPSKPFSPKVSISPYTIQSPKSIRRRTYNNNRRFCGKRIKSLGIEEPKFASKVSYPRKAPFSKLKLRYSKNHN